VMVTHDLHAAEYAGSVYHLEKGNLLPWNPADVLQPVTGQ
jgi:ABC-type lipoprotein export system ATPase subunit